MSDDDTWTAIGKRVRVRDSARCDAGRRGKVTWKGNGSFKADFDMSTASGSAYIDYKDLEPDEPQCEPPPQPVEPTPGGDEAPQSSGFPWSSDGPLVLDRYGTLVARCTLESDAAFIVRAVNASQRPEPSAPVNGNESALAHAERMHAENSRLRAVHKRHKRELRRLNAVIRTNNMVMQAQSGQLLALQSLSFKRHSEPVATGEGEAWSVLRELVPLLYYNTTPEYIEAVKRARMLLAKVDGGGNG
jgi:hypothetical protein